MELNKLSKEYAEHYTFMQLVDMRDSPIANQEAITEALHILGKESYKKMKNGTAGKAEESK